MDIKDIKNKLAEQLPEFDFMTGQEAKQPEANWNSIRVARDNQQLILDVSKVDTEEALEKLRAYIVDMWERAKKVIDV